jgi:hypothetical protein
MWLVLLRIQRRSQFYQDGIFATNTKYTAKKCAVASPKARNSTPSPKCFAFSLPDRW